MISIIKFSNKRFLTSSKFIFKLPLKFKLAVLFILCKFKKRLFRTVSIRIPDKIKFKSKKNVSKLIFPTSLERLIILFLSSISSIASLLNL